ncbi:MAG: chemotaxis protein CheW [Candidatus Methanoperedens sp.]|nr:chemotaxis protein CheW [Candidatus Methanoperedens sp.]
MSTMTEIAVESGYAPQISEKDRILKARAVALAKQPEEKKVKDESIEVVEFKLSHENYGIESSYVREVYPLKELTPVPCTPPFVLGIINVRGKILPVIDLRKFFDLPENGLDDTNRAIIVQNGRMEFGILADVVLEVHSIPLTEIQPPLPTFTGIRAEYIRGVTKERLAVLDIEKILSDKKIIVHEEI